MGEGLASLFPLSGAKKSCSQALNRALRAVSLVVARVRQRLSRCPRRRSGGYEDLHRRH